MALATGAAVVMMFGLAGCSASVSQADVEASVKAEVDKEIPGSGPVTCPTDLAAEVGKSLRCEFEVEGQPVDVVATVTSVDGSDVAYDILTEARPVAKALLDQKIVEQLQPQATVTIESADCSGDLPPTVGGTVTCAVTGGGETVDFTVSVTAVDGGLINYSIDPVA